jgi:ABC-2 type transport system permease protein
MVNWKSRKLGDILWFANAMVAIVLINLLASDHFFRIDLTEEDRYSIKDQTRTILHDLEDDVYVEVFLEGELNAGFKRFQKSILETLDEFKVYSDNKVHYILTNPSAAAGKKAQSEFMAELAARGVQPTNVIDTKDGQRNEKIIFPGVIVSYGGAETGVTLLKGNRARTPEEEINQSIEGIEFELANAIYKLANTERKRIGLITGHGELDSLDIASFNNDLLEVYDVFTVNLDHKNTLANYDALIIAKPTRTFSALDKYKLDQYIVQGGNVMFLVDKLEASMDSASREDYFAVPYDLNLDDLLFRYGVRINPVLLQDQSSSLYPVITGQRGGKPQFRMMNWPFFPLINHYADHPITRNLDAVVLKFANSIDTVKAEGVRKTPLLLTSAASKTLTAPVKVSVNELRQQTAPEGFTSGGIPAGYLLEGTFTSLFKNRFAPDGAVQMPATEPGKAAKLIVIADGDIIRNELNPRSGQPQPLGFDPFSNYTFANRDLLMNALAYLTEKNGLIQARTKQVKIRPLDREKAQGEKMKWQVLNLALPLVLLMVYGIARTYWRRKKFASF